MVAQGTIVRVFCFCWSFRGYYGTYFFKKYSVEKVFVFGYFGLIGLDPDYVVPVHFISL